MALPPDSGSSKQPLETQSAERLEPEKFKRADLASHRLDNDLLLEGDQQKPDATVESRFEKDATAPVRSSKLLFLGISLLICALIATPIYYNSTKEIKEPFNPEAFVAAQQRRFGSNEPEGANKPEDPELVSKQLKRLVANYCSSKTLEERIKYCRKVPGLAEKMANYYQTNPLMVGEVSERFVTVGSARVVSGISFFITEVPLGKGRRIVLPACQTDEAYLIDWEAAAAWQESSWAALEVSGEAAKMRVSIDVDTFFIGEFNTKTHLCVRLRAPNLDFPCYAYIERSSRAYRDLAPVIANWRAGNYGPAEVILRISHAETIRGTQFFTVEDTVALSWIDPHI